jgi:hypothetical protein
LCKICGHPEEADQLESFLLAGKSFCRAAKDCGLPLTSLRRHVRKCIDPEVQLTIREAQRRHHRCFTCDRGLADVVERELLAGHGIAGAAVLSRLGKSSVFRHVSRCVPAEIVATIRAASEEARVRHIRVKAATRQRDSKGQFRKVIRVRVRTNLRKKQEPQPYFRDAEAKREARELIRLLNFDGQNVAKLRDNITISAGEAIQLRKIISAFEVERLVEYRAHVMRHFDRIIQSPELSRIIAEAAIRRARVVAINKAVHAKHKTHVEPEGIAEEAGFEETEDTEETFASL